MVKIIIDGNDGTGKTTLVAELKALGLKVRDRGMPTMLTEIRHIDIPSDELYIILDTSVDICQKRLLSAGKDITEKYHTKQDLEFYRGLFLSIATAIKGFVVDSSGSKEQTLSLVLEILRKEGLYEDSSS